MAHRLRDSLQNEWPENDSGGMPDLATQMVEEPGTRGPLNVSVMNRRSSPWVRRVDLRRKESRTASSGLREESRRDRAGWPRRVWGGMRRIREDGDVGGGGVS
ncbi:hypothetical protein EYF80_052361 [Liparis tanakae]|uniref:Uncharacterized protein n=1 Tax=Liparis tanakae TaxID=230148 RepID=A0A4Z2F988_9TELE|nr:hypothetical protein EYF80_052361 [Liparis tanakae]